jgi:hypothetical protein
MKFILIEFILVRDKVYCLLFHKEIRILPTDVYMYERMS